MKQILFLLLTATVSNRYTNRILIFFPLIIRYFFSQTLANAQLVTTNITSYSLKDNSTVSNITITNTTGENQTSPVGARPENGLKLNLTTLAAVNLTSAVLNGTVLLKSTSTSILNATHVDTTPLPTSSLPTNTALLNETQSTLNTTNSHVNVTSIDAVKITTSALNGTSVTVSNVTGTVSLNVTLNSANKTPNLTLLHPANVNLTENVIINTKLVVNATNDVSLNTTVSIVNGTTINGTTINGTLNHNNTEVIRPAASNSTISNDTVSLDISRSVSLNETVPTNGTLIPITGKQITNSTSMINNTTTGIVDVVNQTIGALKSAAASNYHLIKLVSVEITMIKKSLLEKTNTLIMAINTTSRHIRELFFNSQPSFTVYSITDLQNFSSTVEKLVAGIGKNISGMYEEALTLVSQQIMTTTTVIADTATNISLILRNATANNKTGAEVCATRINPDVVEFSNNYIKLVGACSTDQEKRVKTLAMNTISTSESLFTQGASIVNKINSCMNLPIVNVNDSQTCVSDVSVK
jgi:hypothetical protein